VVTPDASEVDDPTLLDISPPHLRIYPTDSVIAEKFQAMVVLGMGNSRMKDFMMSGCWRNYSNLIEPHCQTGI